jgi:hypothetical protein
MALITPAPAWRPRTPYRNLPYRPQRKKGHFEEQKPYRTRSMYDYFVIKKFILIIYKELS